VLYSPNLAPIQIIAGDTRQSYSFSQNRLLDDCRSFSQKHRIDRRFESWVAGLRPVCFLVTFCTTQKVTTRLPLQGASRFSKPRSNTQKKQIHTIQLNPFAAKKGHQTAGLMSLSLIASP
jgi:hypothetical protein